MNGQWPWQVDRESEQGGGYLEGPTGADPVPRADTRPGWEQGQMGPMEPYLRSTWEAHRGNRAKRRPVSGGGWATPLKPPCFPTRHSFAGRVAVCAASMGIFFPVVSRTDYSHSPARNCEFCAKTSGITETQSETTAANSFLMIQAASSSAALARGTCPGACARAPIYPTLTPYSL